MGRRSDPATLQGSSFYRRVAPSLLLLNLRFAFDHATARSTRNNNQTQRAASG